MSLGMFPYVTSMSYIVKDVKLKFKKTSKRP